MKPTITISLVVILLAAAISAAQPVPPGFAPTNFAVSPDPIVFSGSDVTLTITSSRDIMWGTVYYLSNNVWKPIEVQGTRIGATDWMLGPISSTITIPASDLTGKQKLVLLAYGCARSGLGWDCSKDANNNVAWELLNVPITIPIQPTNLKILPPETGVYLGAHDQFGGTDAFEEAIGKKVALGKPRYIRDGGAEGTLPSFDKAGHDRAFQEGYVTYYKYRNNARTNGRSTVHCSRYY